MRQDFKKLLCERERSGSSMSYKQVRHSKMFDDEAPRESMKKRYIDRKELNENLSPLWRFLRKSCGRKWDNVYSDIKGAFDARSAIGIHIYQHLYHYVSVKVKELDGVFYVDNYYGNYEPLKDSRTDFYVHPKTKILLENKAKINYNTIRNEILKKEKEKQNKVYRSLGNNKVAVRRDENGPWFIGTIEQPKDGWENKVYYAPITNVKYERKVRYTLEDMFFRKSVRYPDYAIVEYKSASKKDIKKCGLS